jgi:hypothetical protein
MATERLKFEFDGDASKFTQAIRKSEKSVDGFSSNLAKVGGVIAGAFAVDKIMEFGSSVIETTATFQRFESVLTNTLGSSSEAQKALDRITDFASKTPFSVSELTDSFVRLANQGFKPTSEEMRKLGDLASSTGKDFVQLTEAVIDAQVGEFERLKEFGIRASKQGDQVTFAFKGVKTQVDFTADAINDYVLSLGDLEGVSGAMVGISKTLGGQISNLGDNFDRLKVAIGEKLQPILSTAISTFSSLFDKITNLLNPQEALINKFRDAKKAVDEIEEASSDLSDTQKKLLEISNARKRQRLAEIEKEIQDATKNLTSKIEEQKKELKDANEELIKRKRILDEQESRTNATASNTEHFTKRLEEQNIEVTEQENKLNLLNEQLTSFKTKIDEIINPQEQVIEKTQTTNKELEKQKLILDEVKKSLSNLQNQQIVYGSEIDIASEKIKIYQDAMVDLLNAGMKPTDASFVSMKANVEGLSEAQDSLNRDYEETVKQLESVFGAQEKVNEEIDKTNEKAKDPTFTELIEQYRNATGKLKEELSGVLSDKIFGAFIDGLKGVAQATVMAFADMAIEGKKSFGEMINVISKMIQKMVVALLIQTALQALFQGVPFKAILKTLAVGTAIIAGAGILAKATEPKQVQGFAKGGIVTRPTMGIIGEAGQSEAVIPLNRLPQMMGSIGGNQKGEFTLRGQDLILALERAGDFRARITG